MKERYIVAIVDEEWLLSSRYPEAVGAESAHMPVRVGRAADLSKPEVFGAVVDSVDATDVLSALRSGKPILLGLGSLATLVREAPESTSTLLEFDWIPFLPTGLNAEVLAATEILKTGSLGAIRSCQLITYVGPVTAEAWEQDAPFARSFLEATVLGLDLLTNLLGRSVDSTRWLAIDTRTNFGMAVHEFGPGTIVLQEIVPSHLAANPLFTATAHCEGGRVLLRDEFAPGGVTVWDASSRSFRSPALSREKLNIQAPDTVRGGLETTALIAALGDTKRDDLPSREHALEITRHAIASGAADAWQTGGGDRERT